VEESREFRFSIVRHIGVLAEGTKGWKKEVNLVSWNDRPPKLDLREWDENHVKMTRGITLNAEESGILRELIADVEGLFAGTEVRT
jgi:hypothetical protein